MEKLVTCILSVLCACIYRLQEQTGSALQLEILHTNYILHQYLDKTQIGMC